MKYYKDWGQTVTASRATCRPQRGGFWGCFLAAFIFVAGVFSTLANADTPLNQARFTKKTSANKLFSVASDPSKRTTYATNKAGTKLWEIKGWFREYFVSNDGSHFVSVYGGANLLPENYSDDLILASIWKDGVAQFHITVSQVIPDRSILVKTTSHYLWGDVNGFDEQNRLVIKRVDGKELTFDLASGRETTSPHGKNR